MRLIKINNCSYELYNKIRNAIMSTVPWAIFNQDYSPELKMSIFNFWDVEYIPDSLKPFIVQPPASRENKELLKEEMKKVGEMK